MPQCAIILTPVIDNEQEIFDLFQNHFGKRKLTCCCKCSAC